MDRGSVILEELHFLGEIKEHGLALTRDCRPMGHTHARPVPPIRAVLEGRREG